MSSYNDMRERGDGLRPKKGLGQNFLTDANIVARIIEAAGLAPGDHVLEIGPGRGALTRAIAASGAKVLALELDRQLVPLLQAEFSANANVEIVHGDVLTVDLGHIVHSRHQGRWKVVANLPYNISSQVLIRFIDDRRLFSRLILMLQREVGERLVAPPGCKEYGILTPFCRMHYDVRREFIVKPGSFYPVPKVDSVVLRFDPLAAPRCHVSDEGFFRTVVKAAFAQRRKTLWNCLKAGGFLPDDAQLAQVLQRCSIDGCRRGETLSLEEFALLTEAISSVR